MSLRSIFHFVISIYYILTISYDLMYIDIPMMRHERDMKFMRGRLKYLTIWNMLLQATFFTISAINDVIGTNENYPRNQSTPFIRKLKDGILTCLAFPLSMFVGLTFWGLYAVDRELILPKAIDPFLPSWLNHAMHTNIMIFILIEMFISFRKYPSRKFSLTVLTGFLLAYLIWIHYIHAKSGLWVYPILNVLNLPLRIVFFAGLLGLCVILYIVGEKLNNFVWRKELLLLQKSGHAASGKKRKS